MIASLLEILKFEYFNLFQPYIFLCKIIKVLEKAFDVFLLVRMFRNALVYEKPTLGLRQSQKQMLPATIEVDGRMIVKYIIVTYYII